MKCQVDKAEHFQQLLFVFNKGSNDAKLIVTICAVYKKGSISEKTARKRFTKFKHCNFDLIEAPRSKRPVEFDEERLNDLLHNEGL